MICFVHDLVGTDAVSVIPELQNGLPAVAAHLLKLAAVPVLPLPAEEKALRGVGEVQEKGTVSAITAIIFLPNKI